MLVSVSRRCAGQQPYGRRLKVVVWLGMALALSGKAPADGSSVFDGGPLLGGASAGTVEGGNLSPGVAFAGVDPSTGAAHSSVAFRLETARGGVQPALSLSYSSAAGQREAGVGWGLDIGAIERMNQAGVPTGSLDPANGKAVTAKTDRFAFGGAPLVPICLVENGACSGAQSGEKMPGWAKDGWNYFRLEVDTTFERFFWSPNHATWVVENKDGETREYGVPLDDSSSRGGVDLDTTGRDPRSQAVFRWNLVRRHDPMGLANEIVYVWQALGSPVQGRSPIASLTDVYDTSAPGSPTTLSSFAHHTQLVWDDDPGAAPAAMQPSVFRVRPLFRLAQVNVWSAAETAGARYLARSYQLAYYEPGTQGAHYARSLLKSVRMMGACPSVKDPGGTSPIAASCATLPATSFTYTAAAAPTGWKTMSGLVPGNSAFVDLDGDGFPDSVTTGAGMANPAPLFARNKAGRGFGGANPLPFHHTGSTQPDVGWFAESAGNLGFFFGNWAQVDGPGTDGFYDSSFANGYTQSVFYAPQQYRGALALVDTAYGPASDPHPRWWCVSPLQDTTGAYMNGVADLVGDGIPSCWSIQGYSPNNLAPLGAPYFGLTTMDPDGSVHPFSDTVYPATILSNVVPPFQLGPDGTTHTTAFAPMMVDLTGSGVPDLVWLWSNESPGAGNGPAVQQGMITVIAGRGDGTFGAGFTVPMPACTAQWPTDCSVAFIDLNGDGKADFVAITSLGASVTINNGVTASGINWGPNIGFGAPPFTDSTDTRMQTYGPEAADLQGTGVPDLLFVAVANPGQPTGFSFGTVNYVNLLGGASPPLLRTILNGRGATTTLDYATTSNLGAKAEASGHPWGTNSTQVVNVVTRISTSLANADAGGPYVTEYEYQGASSDAYAGAMYDKRFRRFNGFGFVRTRIKAGSKLAAWDVTDTYYEPSLSVTTTSPDIPWDAVKGLPVFSERYATDENGAVVEPLQSTHTEYKIAALYKGLDGRIVRQVVPELSDTWLYDPAQPSAAGATSFSTLQDVDDASHGAVSLSKSRAYVPRPWPSSHMQTEVAFDSFGNPTSTTEKGIVGKDEPIVTSTTWTLADGDWMWRPKKSTLKYADAAAAERSYGMSYDDKGRLTRLAGNLTGTLALRGGAGPTPVNASPMSDPSRVLVARTYDPQFGNLVSVTSGAGLRSLSYAYDPAYQHLPASLTVETGGPNSVTLTRAVAYDRGLEVPTTLVEPTSAPTRLSYDIFGRPTAVYLPDPATGAADAEADILIAYVDADGGPYQRVDTTRNLGRTAEGGVTVQRQSHSSVYFDGLGRASAAVSNGGAMDTVTVQLYGDKNTHAYPLWIVSGAMQRDGRGNPRLAYESFFTDLPNALPGASPPAVPPGTKSRALAYDPFARVVQVDDFDGTLIAKSTYHDVSVDLFDAADVHAARPTYSTLRRDGHGRTVETDQRTANGGGVNGDSADTLTTSYSYLAAGEISRITRGSSAEGALYTRWMQYDSLGRLVLNVEPNTSAGFVSAPGAGGAIPAGLKALTYAYDDVGDMVGFADARGCGVNFAYDGAGRETAEVYVPCDPAQPPQAATPAVTRVYDVPDDDQIGARRGNPTFLKGRLAATYSRGEHTQYAYDGRGRVTTVSRQMPNPPGVAPPIVGVRVGPYAPTWYQMAFSYDLGNRVVAQSTGAAVPELMGSPVAAASDGRDLGRSVVTTAWDERGVPTSVGGSYGVLAQKERRAADGRLLGRVYGDVAGATAAYGYDGRNRLASASVALPSAPALWTKPTPGYSLPTGALTTPLLLEQLSYTYDAVNNPVSIGDLRAPAEWPSNVVGPMLSTMSYDDLHRVTSVAFAYPPFTSSAQAPPFVAGDPQPPNWVQPANRTQALAFGYDALSNLTESSDNSDALLQRSSGSLSYGFASSGGVTGPNQVAQGQSGSSGYVTTYDAAGNLASIAAETPGVSSLPNDKLFITASYAWDEAGRLGSASRLDQNVSGVTRLPGASVADAYLYDGHGNRTWRSSNASGEPVYFLDVFPSLHINATKWTAHPTRCVAAPCERSRDTLDYDVDASTEQVYLASGNSAYGRLVHDPALPSPSSNPLHVFLELANSAGSTSTVIDKETSELVEKITYLADGQTETDYRPQRWRSFREGFRYTGKYDDYEVGLIYYGARYFSPWIERWASPDPLFIHGIAGDADPYGFVRNAPYRYVDPVGFGDAPQQQTDPTPVCDSTLANTCSQEYGDVGPNGDTSAGSVYGGPFGDYGSTAPGRSSGGGGGPYQPPPPPPVPHLAASGVSSVGRQGASSAAPSTGGYSIDDPTIRYLETAQWVVAVPTGIAITALGGEAFDAAAFRFLLGGSRVASMLGGSSVAGATAAARSMGDPGPTVFGHAAVLTTLPPSIVPQGASITLMARLGETITVDEGIRFAEGDLSAIREGAQTFLSGSEMPGIVVFEPPAQLPLLTPPDLIVVSNPTALSDLLKTGMGNVKFVGCTAPLCYPY